VNGLLARYPEIATVGQPLRPGIVHRLDAGTSGLMVVARSAAAYDSLVAAMSDHSVHREYLALAWGHFDSVSGVVDADIGRDPRDPMKMAVVRDGKWARTHFEVVDAFDSPADLSLVRCRLETGRTHQIRIHMAESGHVLCGERVYTQTRKGTPSDESRAPRVMLHAAELGFVHPVTGAELRFTSPLPEDMRRLLAALRKACEP
jgi:23S rRNA pseudouridine1911/1915/1917 synthase